MTNDSCVLQRRPDCGKKRGQITLLRRRLVFADCDQLLPEQFA
jgi:hypothetical protein